jgi:alkylation response protein AidB-like acyl-CoA dehydrogenase
VPEANAGAGLRFEDVAIVIEEAGRAALPLPLTTTLLASRTVARAPGWAPRGALLSRIASGETSATLGLSDYPQRDSAAAIAAARDGDGWLLTGSHPFVPYGPLAGVVLAEATADGAPAVFVIPSDSPRIRWTDLELIDRTVRHYDMSLDNVSQPAEACLATGPDAELLIRQLIAEWTAALAAESLGAAGRMLEMSVAYAKERVQFGRPIGANQAVKGRLADMGAAVERMRAAVYQAAVKIDAGAEDRDVAVAMAKVATAGQGAWLGSQAIHVHGGVGYTWEHDLHLYFKRIKSNELLLGDDSVHLARIADAVL